MANVRQAFLSKEQLEDGAYYAGECRNASVARWCEYGTGGAFVYMRYSFWDRFPEIIRHPEDDDGHDLFYPIQKIAPTECQLVPDDEFEAQRAWLKN